MGHKSQCLFELIPSKCRDFCQKGHLTLNLCQTNHANHETHETLTRSVEAQVNNGCHGNWAIVARRRREGRHVHKETEKIKIKRLGLRVGNLNVGTVT